MKASTTPATDPNAEILGQLDSRAHRHLIDGEPISAGLLFAAAATIRVQAQRLDRLSAVAQQVVDADADADADGDVEIGDQLAPRRGGGSRAAGEHRHRFDARGVCQVASTMDGGGICGKVKGAGGRPVKRPDAAARALALPLTAHEHHFDAAGVCAVRGCSKLSDAEMIRRGVHPTAPRAMSAAQLAVAADKYADGGQGSSSTRDR